MNPNQCKICYKYWEFKIGNYQQPTCTCEEDKEEGRKTWAEMIRESIMNNQRS